MSVGLAVGLTLLTLGLVVAAGAVVGLGLLARCLTTTLTLTTTLIITLTLAITFLSFNISSPYIISPHRHPTVTPTVTPTINPTVTHPRYLTRTRGDYYTQVGRAAEGLRVSPDPLIPRSFDPLRESNNSDRHFLHLLFLQS